MYICETCPLHTLHICHMFSLITVNVEVTGNSFSAFWDFRNVIFRNFYMLLVVWICL